MRRLLAFALAVVIATACSDQPTMPDRAQALQLRAAAGPMVGICHVDGGDKATLIRVPDGRPAQVHFDHGDEYAPCTVDFEEPKITHSQIINPYTALGVTFSTPEILGDEVVGLAANYATSACVEPVDDNQKLGTGRAAFGVGTSGLPIRADFGIALRRSVTVSVEVQTLAGKTVSLQLFGTSGDLVAEMQTLAGPADGTCGLPGDPRARLGLSTSAEEPVAYAIIDVVDPGVVFVIDNFAFGDP